MIHPRSCIICPGLFSRRKQGRIMLSSSTVFFLLFVLPLPPPPPLPSSAAAAACTREIDGTVAQLTAGRHRSQYRQSQSQIDRSAANRSRKSIELLLVPQRPVALSPRWPPDRLIRACVSVAETRESVSESVSESQLFRLGYRLGTAARDQQGRVTGDRGPPDRSIRARVTGAVTHPRTQRRSCSGSVSESEQPRLGYRLGYRLDRTRIPTRQQQTNTPNTGRRVGIRVLSESVSDSCPSRYPILVQVGRTR